MSLSKNKSCLKNVEKNAKSDWINFIKIIKLKLSLRKKSKEKRNLRSTKKEKYFFQKSSFKIQIILIYLFNLLRS